ncbi:hypothetical protein BVC80_1455g16 [Macleaya cordata]|uniref:Retrotransposon gag domain-containing protein n=1 Tax=Macleaya cordata TaxID=56857 RepID=A0A200Q0H6_MACCD|nr:hypothetical protein BVC80_1455g16 [Macleaya cordata]
MGYVDGSFVAPPPEIDDGAGHPIANPAYGLWRRADQFVYGIICATLHDSLQSQTVGLLTSRDVWLSLEWEYVQPSEACAMQLHLELQTIQKGQSSMTNYLNRLKSIADALNAID